MNNTDIEIVEIGQKDVPLLRTISITTFKQTFDLHNSESNMDLYLSNNLNTEQLLEELNTPSAKFYFAYFKKELAGYLKINFPAKTTVSKYVNLLEVERIYILQDFQRQSIGNYLLDFSIQTAQKNKLKGIWLGVWEHNSKAISFYKKIGFVQTDSHVFKLGHDEQTDIIMELTV